MIIRDYIIKELLRTFFGVFLIIFLIIISTQLLKSLAAVVNGKISIDFLFALIALKNIESLTLILPLTLFLSILLALSRLYKDSEMIALSACGIGPGTLLKCVVTVLGTFIFLELGLALVIGPWASSQIQVAEEEFKAQAIIEFITPGHFNFSSDSNRVLYTETLTDKTQLNNVFLYFNKDDNDSVLASENAQFVTDENNGSRYVVFQQGNRYDGIPGTLKYRHIQFKDYGILLEGKTITKVDFDRESLPVNELWKSDKLSYTAELQWRISQILMMIILALLAAPLSKSTPRQGRYAKMAIAVLIYIIYSNLLVVAMNWVKKGLVNPYIGMWWVHVLFFMLFLFLFARQMGWLALLKRKNHNQLHYPEEFEDLVKN